MSKLATFAVALGALVLAFVTLSPSSAEAGWRGRGWYGGPGVNVYVGPRWGCTARAIAIGAALTPTVTLTPIIPIGAAAVLAPRLVLGTRAS